MSVEHAADLISPALEAHFAVLLKALQEGKVVPFLGAAVNLCGRHEETTWSYGQFHCLPSGAELASHLARSFGYPLKAGTKPDLLRVAQYVSLMMGVEGLYEELRNIFDGEYPTTALHTFFAGLPGMLRAKGYPRTTDPLRRRLVLVTTNYDDVLERAFNEAEESFHLVTYVAEGDWRGKFLHWPAGEKDGMAVIESPNEYKGLTKDERPVILKIHGAIDRQESLRDSFVITEDDYIDYLTRTDLSGLLPVPLPAKLQQSQFLFLGYSLSDWNLRAILHRIWRDRKRSARSWAVQLNPEDIDQKFWSRRDVDIINIDLKHYIDALEERVRKSAKPPRRRHVSNSTLVGTTELPTTGEVSAPSPYKGLMPYTEADAAFFFGRDAEREVIIANLRAARLTLLYGESGVGKSSVLGAGVCAPVTPALRREPRGFRYAGIRGRAVQDLA